jgi:hypothetical protein
MKLTRKSDNDTKYPKKEQKAEKGYRNAKEDLSGMYENDDSIIPYGKHAGKTLGWVKEYDDWYVKWLYEKNLMKSWGLMLPVGEPVRKKYSSWLSSKGEYWVGIREILIACDKPVGDWLYKDTM